MTGTIRKQLMTFILGTMAACPLMGESTEDRVARVLQGTPLIDGHNDLPGQYRRRVNNQLARIDLNADLTLLEDPMDTDIPRLRKGMVGGQFWSVYVPISEYGGKPEDVQRVIEQIDLVDRMVDRYHDTFEMAYSAADIIRIHAAGKIASLIGMEGGHAIHNSLGVLRRMYRLGARYMTLTHVRGLQWADAATDEHRHGGLTLFGEEVIREMNRLGMMVDLSHVSPDTMRAAIAVSEAPVIFSHSSAYGVVPHVRNVPDDVLKLTAEHNGVVMVTFYPSYVSEATRVHEVQARAESDRLHAQFAEDKAAAQLEIWREANPAPRPTLEQVADHIDHIRWTAGIDHIGIGGDYDGMPPGPTGLEDVSRYPALLAELLKRDYSDDDIAKIAGRNILRVMEATESIALKLQQQRTPSEMLFEENVMPAAESTLPQYQKRWLAGDHHIHSQFSVGWDYDEEPPRPILGGDAIYPLDTNAKMAKQHGLSWMVGTDHGGPEHSKISLEQTYPSLLEARMEVPEVIQFFGLELNSPGGDHSSLIIPHTTDEARVLHKLESGFDKREVYPLDASRDNEEKMIEALAMMRDLTAKPVVIANHPSRSSGEYGIYGAYDPAEFRSWNDAAPEVAVGMAGAPGHQANYLDTSVFEDFRDWVRGFFQGGEKSKGRVIGKARGAYAGFPTMGGFDQMTARTGGFWDSMLGEGRRWWITANSDSHRHHSEGGKDFWPGEYSKTYVFAEKNHDSILEGIRNGHVFVTTGDLINELHVEVLHHGQSAAIGEEITVPGGSEVTINIRVRDPELPNFANENPTVARVDLITGEVLGRSSDPSINKNDTTKVIARFSETDWRKEGEFLLMQHRMTVDSAQYIRVRGTNTGELEPQMDPPGENPWSDLWFYSNPVFINLE